MFYGLKYFNITLVQSVDPNVINRDKRRADFFALLFFYDSADFRDTSLLSLEGYFEII